MHSNFPMYCEFFNLQLGSLLIKLSIILLSYSFPDQWLFSICVYVLECNILSTVVFCCILPLAIIHSFVCLFHLAVRSAVTLITVAWSWLCTSIRPVHFVAKWGPIWTTMDSHMMWWRSILCGELSLSGQNILKYLFLLLTIVERMILWWETCSIITSLCHNGFSSLLNLLLQQVNDSSVIVSCLETFLEDPRAPFDQIVSYYPALESRQGSKTIYEYPNKYFVMYGEKPMNSLSSTAEQRK